MNNNLKKNLADEVTFYCDANTTNFENLKKLFKQIATFEDCRLDILLANWNTAIQLKSSKRNSSESTNRNVLKKLLEIRTKTIEIHKLNDERYISFSENDIEKLNLYLIFIESKIKHVSFAIENKISKSKKNLNPDDILIHQLYTAFFSNFSSAIENPIKKVFITVIKEMLEIIRYTISIESLTKKIRTMNMLHLKNQGLNPANKKGRPKSKKI